MHERFAPKKREACIPYQDGMHLEGSRGLDLFTASSSQSPFGWPDVCVCVCGKGGDVLDVRLGYGGNSSIASITHTSTRFHDDEFTKDFLGQCKGGDECWAIVNIIHK